MKINRVNCYVVPVVEDFYVEIFEHYEIDDDPAVMCEMWEFWLCCSGYGRKEHIVSVFSKAYSDLEEACKSICKMDYLIEYIYDYYNNVINV